MSDDDDVGTSLDELERKLEALERELQSSRLAPSTRPQSEGGPDRRGDGAHPRPVPESPFAAALASSSGPLVNVPAPGPAPVAASSSPAPATPVPAAPSSTGTQTAAPPPVTVPFEVPPASSWADPTAAAVRDAPAHAFVVSPPPPARAAGSGPPAPATAAQDTARLVGDARAELGGLHEHLDELERFRAQLERSAHELVAEYDRLLPVLRSAVADCDGSATPGTADAEEAVLYGMLTVDAGPFADAAALADFERALGGLPGVRVVHVRTFERSRALVDVMLGEPLAFGAALRQTSGLAFTVSRAVPGHVTLALG